LLLRRVLRLGWVLTGLLLRWVLTRLLLGRVLSRLLLGRVLTGLLLRRVLTWLLILNNSNLWLWLVLNDSHLSFLLFCTNVCNLFLMENRAHH